MLAIGRHKSAFELLAKDRGKNTGSAKPLGECVRSVISCNFQRIIWNFVREEVFLPAKTQLIGRD
jgi:hypothetical protein